MYLLQAIIPQELSLPFLKPFHVQMEYKISSTCIRKIEESDEGTNLALCKLCRFWHKFLALKYVNADIKIQLFDDVQLDLTKFRF